MSRTNARQLLNKGVYLGKIALQFFPLNWSGLLLLLGAYWAVFEWGKEEYDYILVKVGGVVFIVLAYSILSTLIGAFILYLRRDIAISPLPIDGVTEQEYRTAWMNLRPWWFPFVQINWDWENRDAMVVSNGREEWVVFHRRGEWSITTRKMSISDFFGMSTISFYTQRTASLRIRPHQGRLNAPELMKSLRTGDSVTHPSGEPEGDRVDVRQYVRGDPMRHILWKTYAKTGELVVRSPERAYDLSNKLVAFLIASPDDGPAAAAAMVAIESRALGKEWLFGADGFHHPVQEVDAAIEAIVRSAESEGQGRDLQSFLEAATDSPRQKALIFAPPSQGEWVDRVIVASKSVQLEVLIGVDGQLEQDGFWSMKRWLYQNESGKNGMMIKSEMQAVLRQLHNGNVLTRIVDRRTGIAIDAILYQKVYQ